jgi:hypothetical protein
MRWRILLRQRPVTKRSVQYHASISSTISEVKGSHVIVNYAGWRVRCGCGFVVCSRCITTRSNPARYRRGLVHDL